MFKYFHRKTYISTDLVILESSVRHWKEVSSKYVSYIIYGWVGSVRCLFIVFPFNVEKNCSVCKHNDPNLLLPLRRFSQKRYGLIIPKTPNRNNFFIFWIRSSCCKWSRTLSCRITCILYGWHHIPNTSDFITHLIVS